MEKNKQTEYTYIVFRIYRISFTLFNFSNYPLRIFLASYRKYSYSFGSSSNEIFYDSKKIMVKEGIFQTPDNITFVVINILFNSNYNDTTI